MGGGGARDGRRHVYIAHSWPVLCRLLWSLRGPGDGGQKLHFDEESLSFFIFLCILPASVISDLASYVCC